MFFDGCDSGNRSALGDGLLAERKVIGSDLRDMTLGLCWMQLYFPVAFSLLGLCATVEYGQRSPESSAQFCMVEPQ